uniref:Chemokine interleukin-8-like domain-containing protein n=1 Tax=Neogobius melanostomus TaxID=47308 RepID=A0A8C6TCY2_9GOBI
MEPRACVLLLLLCAALCTAQIEMMDCCLSVADKRLRPDNVEQYRLQRAGHGCDISATVIQVKGKQLCLPPPEHHRWIRRLLKIVDQKKSRQ